MTLFFDRNMGHALPEALRLLGLPTEKHDDHFAANAHDEEWLPEVGRRGWVVITHDKRIRTNESQRKALLDHGVGCFVLRGTGHLTRWAMVRMIARHWDHIDKTVKTAARPFLHRLYARGGAKPEQLPS